MITSDELVLTHDNLKPYVHQTPVLTSRLINDIAEAQLYFKCENFQKVGAFKYRGAVNALMSLTEQDLENGVATHSSGNHAQALALAALQFGTRAFIVMPNNSPEVKINAVQDYGAEIIFCEPTLEARESTLAEVIKQTNAHIVHPYNDERIIKGQSTVAKELLEFHPQLNTIVCPVGGGGLLAGTALSAKYFGKNCNVFAAEPEMADDAYKSFKKGEIVPSVNPNTIADGLKTSLGELNFDIIKNNISDVLLVKEEEIKEAMQLIWQRLKIVVEPSGAVSLAAVLKNKSQFKNKEVGVIFSGGNVELP